MPIYTYARFIQFENKTKHPVREHGPLPIEPDLTIILPFLGCELLKRSVLNKTKKGNAK